MKTGPKDEEGVMRYMRGFCIILIFLIVSVGTAAAGEPAADADTMKVYDLQDTIVVVANRFELPLRKLTYTHQVISQAEMLALSTHSALQAIDYVYPSAYTLDKKVIGYGVGTEGAGSINIRGQGGRPNTGMLVLINGHPDFMGLFGHPLPDVYGTDDIQQVEILSGPASTVFGSQALGGIINIRTHPDYAKRVRVTAEGGTFGTYNTGLNLVFPVTDGGIFLSGRYQKTNGHIDQSGFKSVHLQGGFEYALDPVWHISAHGRYVPFEFDDPARGDIDPAGLGTYGKIRRGTGEILLENTGDELRGSTQIYGNWGHHRFYDGFESHDFTFGLSGYQQWNASKTFSLSFGTDLIRYGGQAENNLVPPGIVDSERHVFNSAGIYALGFYNGIDNTTIKLGVRYQYLSLPLNRTAPVAGITYNLLPNLRVYGNFESGFRFPTMNELYLFPPSNPDLKDERIKSIEGGIWYYWSGTNALRISYYNNDVDNIILATPNPAPPPPVRYSNSGKARQHGIEAQINMVPVTDISLQLAYSYLDPGDITAYNPKNQFKFVAAGHYGLLNVTLSGKYITGLFGDNYHLMPLPDYLLMNLEGSYEINGVEFIVKLQNLLNRKYFVYMTDTFDYPAPGFHLLAGFIWGI